MALQEEIKKQGDYLFKHRSYLPLVLLIVGLGVKIYQEKYVPESILSDAVECVGVFVGFVVL